MLHLPGGILFLVSHMWVQHIPLKLQYVHMKQHSMKTVIFIFTVVKISQDVIYLFVFNNAGVIQCIVEWYNE